MTRSSRKKAKKTESTHSDSGATTGHEAALWAMADALRGSMDAAEYKHVVLGLIFLKYISDVCLLFIHPGAPNLISLRSAGTMPA